MEENGASAEKPTRATQDGRVLILIAAVFGILGFIAAVFAEFIRADESARGIMTFSIVSFCAAAVLGMWGVALVSKTLAVQLENSFFERLLMVIAFLIRFRPNELSRKRIALHI